MTKEQRRGYYLATRVTSFLRSKIWKRQNPEKVRAHKKKWRDTHREQALAAERRRSARWREAHREQKRIEDRERFRKHPDKARVAKARRRALERQAPGSFTAKDLRQLYAIQNGLCSICQVALGKKYHADHILALAKGGSNGINNIQLTCPTCNLRKGPR